MNLYGFCNNNAVSEFDSLGKEIFSGQGQISTEVLVNNCEYHVWNCIEFNYNGTKNEYIKHFLSYTFSHPKIPKGLRRLLAYNLVSNLGLDRFPNACWSVTLSPLLVMRDESNKARLKSKPGGTLFRIRLEATPTFVEKHETCCKRPAEKISTAGRIVVVTPFQREEGNR